MIPGRLRRLGGRLRGSQDGGFLLGRGAAEALARVGGVGLVTLWSLLLTNLLGAEDYGRLVYVQSVVFVAALVGALGMPVLAARRIPAYAASRRPRRLFLFLALAAGVSALGAAAVTAATWGVAEAVGWGAFTGFPLALVLAFAALAALVQTLAAAVRALERSITAAVVEQVAQRLATIIPFALLLAAGAALSPGLALLATAIGAAVVVAWLGHVARSAVAGRGPLGRWPAATWGRLPGLGGRWVAQGGVMMVTPLYYLVVSEADVLMLGAVAPGAAVGIYHVARRLAGFLHFVTMAVNAVGLHRFAAAHDLGDRARLQRLADAMGLLGLVPALGLWLLLAGGGPWLLALFGPGMEAGYLALLIMATCGLLDIALGPAAELLTMAGHERLVGKVNLGFMALTVGAVAVLVPPLGLEGAALASGLSLVAWRLSLAVLAWRRAGIVTCPLLRPRAAIASLLHRAG